MDGHNNLQAGHKIYQLFSKRSYHPDKTTTVHMNVVFLLTDLKKVCFCDGFEVESEWVCFLRHKSKLWLVWAVWNNEHCVGWFIRSTVSHCRGLLLELLRPARTSWNTFVSLSVRPSVHSISPPRTSFPPSQPSPLLTPPHPFSAINPHQLDLGSSSRTHL